MFGVSSRSTSRPFRIPPPTRASDAAVSPVVRASARRADEIELTEYDNGEEEEPDEVEDFPSHGNAGDVWLPQGY